MSLNKLFNLVKFLSALILFFILLNQASAQSAKANCGFTLPDTLLFQNISDMRTVPDIKQLGKFTTIDSIKSPYGLIYYNQVHQVFVALKTTANWEYWQLPVNGTLDKTGISRVDVDNKKSDELVLLVTNGEGTYNYKGALNSLKQTTLVYNLDSKQLLLNIVTRYQCDSASHYYTNGDNKRINTDSLVNLGMDTDNIVAKYTMNIVGQRTAYSCAYFFQPKQLNLQGQCKITPYDGNNSTSLFAKNYQLLPNGFIIKP